MGTSKRLTKLGLLALALGLVFLWSVPLATSAGCGDTGGDDDDDDDDNDDNDDNDDSSDDDDDDFAATAEKLWENPEQPMTSFATERVTYTLKTEGMPAGFTSNPKVTVIGETEVAGQTWVRWGVGDHSNPDAPNGFELWIDGALDQDMKGIGGTIYGFGEATLDAPLEVNGDAPKDEPQVLSMTGVVKNLESGGESTVSVTGTYTMVEDDMTLPSAMGDLAGVRKYVGTATPDGEAIPAIVKATTLEGTIYAKPGLGIVRVSVQPLGFVLDLVGGSDLGSNAGEYNAMQKMAVLQPGEFLSVDTYELNQEMDADNQTHAKMLLELRYADGARASDPTAPDLASSASITFGTTLGYYSHSFTKSAVSVFHPEENGRGYNYWYAYVDQAAKNEPGDRTNYHISVSNGASEPVRVTSRIVYRFAPLESAGE